MVKASQSCCGQPWFEKREIKDGDPVRAISGAGVGNRFLAIGEMFFRSGRTDFGGALVVRWWCEAIDPVNVQPCTSARAPVYNSARGGRTRLLTRRPLPLNQTE